jgi:hypothetical protein
MSKAPQQIPRTLPYELWQDSKLNPTATGTTNKEIDDLQEAWYRGEHMWQRGVGETDE